MAVAEVQIDEVGVSGRDQQDLLFVTQGIFCRAAQLYGSFVRRVVFNVTAIA